MYQVQRKKKKASARNEFQVWQDIYMDGGSRLNRAAAEDWLKRMRGWHPKQEYRLVRVEDA